VLDDAFADGKGEIEAAKGWVALLEPGYDAQRVEVVVEAEAMSLERGVEGFSPAWPKGGWPMS